MMRTVFVLALATGFVAGCSQKNPPPSGAAEQPAPASPARDSQPAAPPATSGPGSAQTPTAEARTTDARRPTTQAGKTASPAAAPKPPARLSAAPESPARDTSSNPVPPAPEFREVTIPAGTSLSVKLLSTLASNTSKVEDPVRASLAKPIIVDGVTAVPSGSELTGSVTDVKESGRIKGRASIAFRFDRLVTHGETYRVQSARVTREAAANRGDDVKKGGIGGGIGAVVGGVVGGGKGAAIGAVAGGTGAVLATKGREVTLAPGTVVTVLLQDAVTVNVPMK